MTEHPIDPMRAVNTAASVVARDYQGQHTGEKGKVVAYSDRPTFVIERPDGSRFSWVADMVFPAEPEPLTDKAVLADALEALNLLVDTKPCVTDTEGNCTQHGWYTLGRSECAHARARRLLNDHVEVWLP